MNRNRMLMLAAGSLVISIAVTAILYRFVQSRLRPPQETTRIVVAAQKLPLGTRLDEKSVRLADWPKSIPLEGSVSDPKEVVGRGVIVTMLPNEPVVDTKLAPREGGAGLPSVIPDGMRAVSVKVNDVIGVAGFVLPGTRVDVIMTGTPRNNEDVAARMILENAQVLAAGQKMEQDAQGKPQSVQVVTLLVTPEQAQQLALATVDGRIQLALRNPLDSEQKDPAAVQRSALFLRGNSLPPPEKPEAPPKKTAPRKPAPTAQVAATAPPPPPDRTMAVELFLGVKKETVTFTEKNQ